MVGTGRDQGMATGPWPEQDCDAPFFFFFFEGSCLLIFPLFLFFLLFLVLALRAAALGLLPPACGADGPAYGQPPLVLAPCKQILSGLERKSLIKQLCVYNYVLN